MPFDVHEVLSTVPCKLWIFILGRRNFVSKDREQDECSEHRVDNMIPPPCWNGVGVAEHGSLSHSTVRGAKSPSWNQLPILSGAPALSRFAPLDSGCCHMPSRRCQPPYFLLKPEQSSSRLLWTAQSWSWFHIHPYFLHLILSQFWYNIGKPQCWLPWAIFSLFSSCFSIGVPSQAPLWVSFLCTPLFTTPTGPVLSFSS